MLIFAAVGTATSALADTVELPPRRPGYWEIRMVHEMPAGAPDTTLHACIDAATDKAMIDAGTSAMQEICARTQLKRDGDAYVRDSVCQMGPMKTTSHVVITGDFQSAYMTKITGDISGMPKIGNLSTGPMKTATTQNAKWLSAECPGNMKAGDMAMPGGMTVNVNDMIKSLGVAKTPWQP